MPNCILPDYVTQIRAQITKDVRRLKRELEKRPGVTGLCVRLGYLINTHRGKAVFNVTKERIAGLPLVLDREQTQTLAVVGLNTTTGKTVAKEMSQ